MALFPEKNKAVTHFYKVTALFVIINDTVLANSTAYQRLTCCFHLLE